MIDILSFQTYPVPPSIEILKESNLTLEVSNNTLKQKNKALKNTVLILFISIGIFTTIKIIKKNKSKKNKK